MSSPRTAWTLRDARSDDAESIAVLHAGSWRRTYRGMMRDEFLDGPALDNRRIVWRERLTTVNASQFVCVADLESSIVGFICAFAREDPVWGSYIDNLHVAPNLHGSGIGRALMRRTAEWLYTTHPDAGVYLWVMQANTGARQFYERLGARHAETIDKEDPGGGRAPNCRYVWSNPQLLIDASPAEAGH